MANLEFFKSAGLNLYLVKDKLPAQKVGSTLVGINGWESLTDFKKYSKQIKEGDNMGFLSGKQYASGRYIEVLDFDIYDKITNGINEPTMALYKKFESLDTNNKIGFFSGSTCGNYGVLIDSTNNEVLREKIEECKQINKCKIKVEELEILYCNNVVLPPSMTNCKKCRRTHVARKMLNDEIGFCIPNQQQTEFLVELFNNYIASKTTKIINTPNGTISTKVEKVAKSALIDVSRIHKNKMLVILECLKESRFTAKQTDGWGQLLVQVANANNSDEVIKAFWERCRVGAYSGITYNEIANAIAGVKISNDFNNANLWKMAKEDNPELYNKHFNKYDEPAFEYEKITFTDDAEKPSHFINYKQVKKYFGDSKYCFIKSSLGTGKTQFIKNVVEKEYSGETREYDWKGKMIVRPYRIAFLTMRQSLARSLMEDFCKLHFLNYLDNDVKKYIRNVDKIIISIDSLEKIGGFDEESGNYIGNTYDLVICDEICSLLKHYDFKEMKNPEKSYQIFKTIIKCSKQTYFLDGDLSNRELGWFNTYIKGKEEVKKPLFNGLTGIKYDLKLSYCKSGQYNKILEALDAGKNIAIVCMSSAECLKMYDALCNKYKCKVIYGNSSDAEKAELCQINSIITNYQCFIYSPSITVGVDINPKIEGVIYKHFDNIFGYVCEGSVSPRDYFQMLARVRNPKSLVINILIANFDMQLTGLYDIIPFDKYYRIMFGDEPVNGLSYIKCWNKWETDNSKYWLDVFQWYANQKGHAFEIVQTTKAEFAEQKKKLEETKSRLNIDLIKSDKAELVFDAVLLNAKPRTVIDANPYEKEDRKVYEDLRQKRIITEEDKELLMSIDIRNNWDNLEYKQERIEMGEAMTHDKLNFEKTVYWQFFGLSNNIEFEDFKENYYRKIDIVKNYVALKKLNEIIEVAPITTRGQQFDGELLNKKIEYLNVISRLIGVDGYKNQTITKEIECEPLNKILQNKDFKITFGIMDKSKGSKKITKKNERDEIVEKAFTRMQIIMRVREVLSEFGFEYEYKQIRQNGAKVNAYDFIECKAVQQYNKKQLENMEEEPEQVEYVIDF